MQIISYLCANFQEMETSYQTNSIVITQLKKAVEVRFGHIPATPADFGELSIAVLRVTGECVSPDTLSRIWGYKKGYSSVRQSTVRRLESEGGIGLHPYARYSCRRMPERRTSAHSLASQPRLYSLLSGRLPMAH